MPAFKREPVNGVAAGTLLTEIRAMRRSLTEALARLEVMENFVVAAGAWEPPPRDPALSEEDIPF